MARSLRIQYLGAYYHVMNRGNRRGDIFNTYTGRSIFVDALADSRETFRLQHGQPEPGAPESQIKIKSQANQTIQPIQGTGYRSVNFKDPNPIFFKLGLREAALVPRLGFRIRLWQTL